MGLLYLGFVVVSTVCMGLVDHRWRLALFDRPARTLAVVAAGSLLFLVWDLVAIESGMYVRGESPAMTGIELLPENPDFEVIHVPPGSEDFSLEGLAVGLIRNTMLM
mgnify:CR=1 FL=1